MDALPESSSPALNRGRTAALFYRREVAPVARDAFEVQTEQYTGPFDLLLDLVARKRLDITAFALAQVTEEFIAYLKTTANLAQASHFLVVAATLLDLKAARLLPHDETEEDIDLELLEARDLLISRLLQYRAFKEAAGDIGRYLRENTSFLPHRVGSDPVVASALPKLTTPIDPEALARRAAELFTLAPPEVVVTHLHDPLVPVAEQVEFLRQRLQELRVTTFSALIADAATRPVVVSRFLALLDLYRGGQISFAQERPLAELTITWCPEAEGSEGEVSESEETGMAGGDWQ